MSIENVLGIMMTMKNKCVGIRNKFREGDMMVKNDGFELDGTFAIVMRGSIKDANIIHRRYFVTILWYVNS